MSIFEVIMLLCFGAAWPFSIAKSYKSRQTGGKSLHFLVVILIGYFSGVIHKVLYNMDAVTSLYCINGLMVSIDIVLYHRNRRLESTAS